MSDIRAFLRRCGMDTAPLDMDAALAEYIRQMRAGLDGEPSSLRMLPSCLRVPPMPKSRRVLALDAGGTNLRTAAVRFDAAGQPAIERLDRRPMPGRITAIDRDGFFAALADALAPLAEGDEPAGFCFSFVMDVLPDHDARIGAFCKELHIDGAEGALLGASLDRALVRRGLSSRRFTLLNDTTAALLAAADDAAGYDGCIGFILGTGTNACYIEPQRGGEIINLESGLYNGFPRGTFDLALDAASERPGDHLAEKLFGGAYMGELAFRCARGACEAGMFSSRFAEALAQCGGFTTSQLSAYCNKAPDNPLAALTAGNADDEAALFAMIDTLYERAACMIAVTLTAIAVHTDSGRSSARPCLVCADGSSFYGAPLLRPKLRHWLDSWSSARCGRHFRFTRRDDAPILGAAIAAAQETEKTVDRHP